jgi:excisionase family DNA binding protein
MNSTATPDIVVPLLLTRQQAAQLIGTSLATLDRMRASGKLPRPLQVGGAVKYRRDDLVQWIKLGCPDLKTFEAATLSS